MGARSMTRDNNVRVQLVRECNEQTRQKQNKQRARIVK